MIKELDQIVLSRSSREKLLQRKSNGGITLRAPH